MANNSCCKVLRDAQVAYLSHLTENRTVVAISDVMNYNGE